MIVRIFFLECDLIEKSYSGGLKKDEIQILNFGTQNILYQTLNSLKESVAVQFYFKIWV